MRLLSLAAVLAALTACSPTTDITRTSTEPIAGRTDYRVIDSRANGDSLRLRLKVDSMRAAQIVAEDVAIKTRAPYERVEVDVFGPGDQLSGRPSGILRWSARGGFNYAKTR